MRIRGAILRWVKKVDLKRCCSCSTQKIVFATCLVGMLIYPNWKKNNNKEFIVSTQSGPVNLKSLIPSLKIYQSTTDKIMNSLASVKSKLLETKASENHELSDDQKCANTSCFSRKSTEEIFSHKFSKLALSGNYNLLIIFDIYELELLKKILDLAECERRMNLMNNFLILFAGNIQGAESWERIFNLITKFDKRILILKSNHELKSDNNSLNALFDKMIAPNFISAVVDIEAKVEFKPGGVIDLFERKTSLIFSKILKERRILLYHIGTAGDGQCLVKRLIAIDVDNAKKLVDDFFCLEKRPYRKHNSFFRSREDGHSSSTSSSSSSSSNANDMDDKKLRSEGQYKICFDSNPLR